MLDQSSAVLYVGKAKDLAKRLASYVHFSGPSHSKTAVMLKQVSNAHLLITHTEKEALILEASLIKRHRPKYNVILRDDKSYPLIKVTVQEDWPRVFMTRKKKKDGARYFGPYASASAMWTTLKVLVSLFPLRRCKGPDLKARTRPCLNYQMNRCLAPCAGKADQATYRAMVDKVVLFLEGRNKNLLDGLRHEMQQASADLAFERAARIRDQISALNSTLEKQVVVSQREKDRDVFGFCRSGASASITLIYVREGVITGNRRFFLEDPYGDDAALLSQTVKLIYDNNSTPPVEILLPLDIDDREILAEHLSDLADRKITIGVPQRGTPRQLVSMANANAAQLFEELEKKSKSWQTLAEALRKKLQLTRLPEHIECLDISNISGTHAVGSLVHFSAGQADKNSYRHYRINQVDGPDDYAMMREVINRRFRKGLELNDLPDLFLVDGGKGQLGVAQSVAAELGISKEVELFGIAKERQEEGEKLYKPGRKNPLVLPPYDPVLLYLMQIRDEAHRYGVTFHRSIRNKATLSSRLDHIPGVGLIRRKKLLKQLGSAKRVASATIDELQAVDGIGEELAESIYRFFRSGDLNQTQE